MTMNKDSLYINVADYIKSDIPIDIFTGGRGTGKTYSTNELAFFGTLPESPKRRQGKTLWMRRTIDEFEQFVKAEPLGKGYFAEYNAASGHDFGCSAISKKIAGVYKMTTNDDGKRIPAGECIGYFSSMLAIAGLRGSGFSDVDLIVYDEFIPEEHVRKIKGEGSAWLAAYDTINRNREFEGLPPVRMILLSNAFQINNPVFQSLGIVATVEKMARSGVVNRRFPKRAFAIHLLPMNANFMEKRANTATAKLTAGTVYGDVSMRNDFAYNDFSLIKSMSLKGFRPVVAYGNYYIYAHKGDKILYCSYAQGQVGSRFNPSNAHDAIAFKREYGLTILDYYTQGKIFFESMEIKFAILEAIGI